MDTVLEICRNATVLSDADAAIIHEMARHMQIIADISQADVFIDCPVADKSAAIVVAQASPATSKSLYRSSVIGELALAKNEPAVLFCLTSGRPVIGARGISQEHTVMQQSVVPIKNAEGKTIGTLIMEQDISEKVEQEKNVERLIETTEHLSETLMQVAMQEHQVPSLMHEGIILFDHRRIISYANSRAYELMARVGYDSPLKGQLIEHFFYGKFSAENFAQHGGMLFEELQYGKATLLVKAVSIFREQNPVGGLILLRDISDIKEKEKQLMIKSAVIKEIHHRVKNNLQTIASLLRLQMRRSRSKELETVYRESINRINSIAIIHEYLAQDGLERVDLRKIVDKIAKTIVSSMAQPKQQIAIQVDVDPVLLPSEKATSLALIVTELIQNSVLHGLAEREQGTVSVRIRLEQEQGRLAIQVADDGKGIGFTGSTAQNGHLGLKIVKTLVQEELEGQLHFCDTGFGTQVSIIYPILRGVIHEPL